MLFALLGMLILPGGALLTISGTWRKWPGLQKFIVAIGLSIAFYPILFYTLHFWSPAVVLGPYKISTILIICAVITGWGFQSKWKELFRFDALEWIAIAVFGLTMITRLWVAHRNPFPAWSDSLHHTLLTQLTAQQGRLPESLDPHFPVPLQMYHLGLYSLAASVEWLTKAPSHSALLWTSQFLNGLAGIGTYLVLDRRAGRLGAIVGAAVVGLFAHMPAFYVNWGRFTQMAAQSILLIAWVVTVDGIVAWTESRNEKHRGTSSLRTEWYLLFGALFSAGLFLLHFRVVAFYGILLGLSLLIEYWRHGSEHRLYFILGSLISGTITFIFITPALWDALRVYLAFKQAPSPLTLEQEAQIAQNFYNFPLSSVPNLVAKNWLLVLSFIASVICLLQRNFIAFLTLLWVGLLFLAGNAYLSGIRVLKFTNLGAILIMYYLPVGLLIGLASHELLKLIPASFRKRSEIAVATIIFLAGLPAGWQRITMLEPHRYFVTQSDLVAMEWIHNNIPSDAQFAINTHFWLPRIPHGYDAGYMIPYLTGHSITSSIMISHLAPTDYREEMLTTSHLVKKLEETTEVLPELYDRGVHYIYIGVHSHVAQTGLRVDTLALSPLIDILYTNQNASVLQIIRDE
ncbi:hypothetical protein KFU94_13760 [Chloroflexi bacterium TSY]|nr:hypothetical protein [Chloroflexi bacterium TSY]MBV7329286.1 hypothetical protein [Chloroflexi bacterium TSY]